jgi:hypothetical protein
MTTSFVAEAICKLLSNDFEIVAIVHDGRKLIEAATNEQSVRLLGWWLELRQNEIHGCGLACSRFTP